MKKLFYGIPVAIFAMLFVSCSSDSGSSQEDFFNINAGNEWVYKRYNYDDDIPGVYAFSGITHNAKVLDIVTMDGLQFSRVKHTLTDENDPSYLNITYEYLRINNNGQLVGLQGDESAEATEAQYDLAETSGTIYHPGNIENYQNSAEQAIGTYLYYTVPQTTIAIEGNPYNVVPYFHKLTQTNATVRQIEIDYEQQTGMIRTQCIGIANGEGYEDRLVSYTLN